MDPQQVSRIADAVVKKLTGKPLDPTSVPVFENRRTAANPQLDAKSGVGAVSAGVPTFTALRSRASKNTTSRVAYSTLDEAMEVARQAQIEWVRLPMERRKEIITCIRVALRKATQELSQLAVDETGLGRVEDKISKNLLVINKTPGPEYLQAGAHTGDDGLCLTEYAPWGVIGAITPTTNPSETVINNGISMLSAGNSVVFNPHPSAKRVSIRTMEIIDEVIVSMGGPAGCLTSVAEPTIDTAQALMTHKQTKLLVVTGGPAVVKAAMGSGKKCVAAGPGNPPVVVDETADLDQAAVGIVKGASLDNNIVCIAEKEMIVVDSVADELKKKLQNNGGFLLSPYQVKQLEKVVLDQSSLNKKFPYPNKNFVGKNASVILNEIGVRVGDDVRIVFCEVDESHPFVQSELLMPVIPLVRVRNVDDAIAMAKRVEHGFRHTAVMYSKNIDNLHRMALVMDTSIFVKNAPSYAGLGLGGEGYTSFTIASPTGDGLSTCQTFSRIRRCTLKDHFRIV